MTTPNTNGSNLQSTTEDASLADSIHLLLRKIDSLETTVHTLQRTMQEAPGLLSMVADMLDEQVRTAAASGIDLEARLKAVLQLLTQLTHPTTMASLQQGLTALSDAPGLFSMAADIVDEQMGSATSKGIDLGSRIQGILTLADRLSAPDTTSAMQQLLEPGAVGALSAIGNAIAERKDQPPSPVGPLGLLKALRDPDVQRATGFLVEITKRLGQELK